jgi:Mg-chelatase subunit ChlD
MTTLKTAATAFVTVLAPASDGVHMGEVSFSTTATLDQVLTGDGSLVIAAINALTSTNLTNLEDAIQKSAAELASARDRTDATSPDFMVIITDGNPTTSNGPSSDSVDAANAAAAAKAAGIKIYVVGIGSDVNGTYLLNDISSGTGYYFSAANWSDLETILRGLGTCRN